MHPSGPGTVLSIETYNAATERQSPIFPFNGYFMGVLIIGALSAFMICVTFIYDFLMVCSAPGFKGQQNVWNVS